MPDALPPGRVGFRFVEYSSFFLAPVRARVLEVFLMGQSRPVRSVHRSEGWTCETLAAHAMPALKPSFYPLDRTTDVFSWDPV